MPEILVLDKGIHIIETYHAAVMGPLERDGPAKFNLIHLLLDKKNLCRTPLSRGAALSAKKGVRQLAHDLLKGG